MKIKIYCILKMSVALFSVIAIASCAAVLSQKKSNYNNPGQTAADANRVKNFEANEYEIFRLVNLERSRQNLNRLEWDDELANMARNYSEKMARENFFDHYEPDGTDAAKRAKKARIKHWSKIGENLFTVERIPDFDAFTVEGWMKSPTHEQNILDPVWTTTGVGVAQADNGDLYIAQIFIQR